MLIEAGDAISALISVILSLLSGQPHGNEKFQSKLGVYTKAAVSANGLECAEMGNLMLKKGGHAVDAAITTLLCEGATAFQSMGLGGGFLMTIYDPKKGPKFLNSRETAPSKASRDMFKKAPKDAMYGGKAVAIPGELKGMWAAHQEYGKLEWADLFEPVIELCEKGLHVTNYIYDELMKELDRIRAEPTLSEILINPETDYPWPVGHKLKRPIYAETLRRLAKGGEEIFYNGEMGEQIIKEIKGFGGIMEMRDLQNYTVEWGVPIKNTIDNMTMYTSPPPGSGVLLTFMVNVMKGFPLENRKLFWQYVIETFKWAYAKRTEFGDPNHKFNNLDELIKKLTSTEYANKIRTKIMSRNLTSENPADYNVKTEPVTDSGTGNVCVLAEDGSAVAVTSTINQILGAMIRSRSTGIVFNDEMDDFSAPGNVNGFGLPPSKPNFIAPGKRPMSSMVPTIIYDEANKRVRMIVGAAGGTKITTSVALTIVHHLFNDLNVKEALDAPRLHHQLIPMFIEYEAGFDEEILTHLRDIGHDVRPYVRMGSTVTAIAHKNGQMITANSDYRREGSIAGF